MSREEAIKIINSAKEMLINPTTKEPISDLYTAYDMAIKALHREQQFLEAGYKNGRVEFNIGGRKFMVKELAQ